MTQTLAKLSIFGLFVLSMSCSSGPTYRVFENVLIDGKTKFYFLRDEGTPTEFERTLGDFVISDTTVQRELLNSWTFPEEKEVHACGSSYGLFVLGGSNKKVAGINSECHTIYLDGKLLQFEPKFLKDLGSNSPTKIAKETADSVRQIFRNR